jgi:hypothetical protein
VVEEEKILDKIKKLLRMKHGGTSAEIETALSLARKLAFKHGIDLSSINPDDESQLEPIKEFVSRGKSRLQFECKYSAMIVDNFFNVRCFIRKAWWEGSKIVLVGTKSNIEIAWYVYGFLVEHFRHEWKTKRGRCRNRQAFMEGMYFGICRVLNRNEREEGLILVGDRSRINKHMEEHYSDLKSDEIKPDRESDIAGRRGYESGLKTNIRKAVTASQPVKQLTV